MELLDYLLFFPLLFVFIGVIEFGVAATYYFAFLRTKPRVKT